MEPTAGDPAAARAVGVACNRNPLPLIVPCHRVVGSTGEAPAEKEQSTHNFNTTGLGAAGINDNSNSNLFSGNDVSAIGIRSKEMSLEFRP